MNIFTPWKLGNASLSNRVVMAPMTRNRADDQGVLPAYVAEYYGQRASAGLIISEGTQPSEAARGYRGTPGLHTDEQQQAWKAVGEAVHARGGKIYCQLMHTGRIGHSSLLPTGMTLVAPSSVPADMLVENAFGEEVAAETPRALSSAEIDEIIRSYAAAAQRAVDAGLDGVELHAANGYLPHQFLSPLTNQRNDEYGGTPENRARFVARVLKALSDQIGADRVGVRISPGGKFNDMRAADDEATYLSLLDQIDDLGLAYLHTLRRRSTPLHKEMRQRWKSTFMLNTGYQGSSELEDLEALLNDSDADLVSVGRYFISNPDLVERWKTGADLTPWDESTFFTQGTAGLTDYESH